MSDHGQGSYHHSFFMQITIGMYFTKWHTNHIGPSSKLQFARGLDSDLFLLKIPRRLIDAIGPSHITNGWFRTLLQMKPTTYCRWWLMLISLKVTVNPQNDYDNDGFGFTHIYLVPFSTPKNPTNRREVDFNDFIFTAAAPRCVKPGGFPGSKRQGASHLWSQTDAHLLVEPLI